MRTAGGRAARMTAALTSALTVALAGVGCGLIGPSHEACSSGAGALPSETVQDWATYGDVIVEWEVAGERRVPPTPEEESAGQRTPTRLAQVRTGAVLWRRPSAPDRLSPPATLEVADVPGARLDLGTRSLTVLTFTDLSGGAGGRHGAEWIALDRLTLDSGRVRAPGDDACASAQIVAAVDGKTPGQVAALLAATPVDPAAVPYLDLDPVVRFQRAADARLATSSYTPGPGPGEKE